MMLEGDLGIIMTDFREYYVMGIGALKSDITRA
jgi:hypothetical protein